jgi:3-phosphoshikimate 1-carboxyvinyltransferase
VADGRDMGTTVFPSAALKVFLTASAEARAQRRHKQLISLGISATLDDLLTDLQERDLRDQTRSASPMQAAKDAVLLDNTALDIDESVSTVLKWWDRSTGFGQS